MGSRSDKADRSDAPLRPALEESLRDDFGRQLVGYLIPAYVVMILIGVFLFRAHASMMRGNEMSVDRSVLAAVNAATLTGFQTAQGPNDYQDLGQYTLVGLTVGGSLLTFIIGGLAVVRILRLPYRDSRVIASAFIVVGAAGFIGAMGLFGQGRTGFDGMSQGISAVGNCGVFVGEHYGADQWQTYLIILPLIVLGGLGLPVLMELFDWGFHQRRMSDHSRTVLAWSAGLYLFFFLLFFVLRVIAAKSPDAAETGEAMSQILASSSVQAINTRTAGMPIEMASSFQHALAMQWAMVLAMIIGASPGGTGGGIKSTTLAEIFRGTLLALRGERPGRPFGIAVVWVGVYLGFALLALFALLSTEKQLPGDRALFLAISALSNVGLAPDLLSVSVPGSYFLAATMLVGRMTPLLILWWMADTTTGAEMAVG